MMLELKVGDDAPDFTLDATTDEKITLSNVLVQGPAVILFYRFDFGPIWAEELSQFRDAAPRFGELGAQVLAISPDSIFAHRAFMQQLNAPFAALSDMHREVATAYGVLNPDTDIRGFKNANRRSLFVVDSSRKICYRYVTDDPSKWPDVQEVIDAVRAVVKPREDEAQTRARKAKGSSHDYDV